MAEESNIPSHHESEKAKSILILSRPAYRAGGKLVGTLLIENVSPSALASIDLVVVGYARLDSRWHRVTSFPFPPDHFHIGDSSKTYWALPRASNIFWTSAMTDLKPTPTYPEYVSQTPQDLLTPQPLDSIPKEEDVPKMEVSRDLQRAVSAKDVSERRFMSYSFSVDLPLDLPPTIVATSCRYYYTVLHRIRFKNVLSTSIAWKDCSFSVLTPESTPQTDGNDDTNLASSKPPIRVVSHGDTLLCTLKSTDIHDSSAFGQLSVHCNGPTCISSPEDCQSMRVSNPSGQPVTVLSVLGANKLCPGGRLILQFDFPDYEKGSSSWAPCFQASACLQGEEIAFQRTSRATPPKRSRARKLLLATAHEVMDPACTERVCLSLLIPSDAPCSMTTDIVHISIWCIVDLTVGTNSRGNSNKGEHQNLRLEIPCRLIHPKSAFETQVDEDELIDEVVDESLDSFYSHEIRRDLRQLSFAVIQYAKSRSHT